MADHAAFPRRELPGFAPVRQSLAAQKVGNPRQEVRSRLLDAGLRTTVPPGARIAITAGSRGMGGFAELLSGVVDAVRSVGGSPFVVPAMGSHGGATAAGQEEVLRRLGITAETIGAPIYATMETHELGRVRNGAMVHLDRAAAEADGIIVVGRVKTHPESAEHLASGLLKMVTVGLGKQRGAQQAHNHGLWEAVREVPRVALDRAKILYGVAVVENGYREAAEIEVVPGRYDAFLEVDRRLLGVAQRFLAHIPFAELDVLVVDQLGKDISGAGMDPNVIGRWRLEGGPHKPDYRQIVVLSLTSASLGNGLGIGEASFSTRRFMDAFDPVATYVNLLTAMEPGVEGTREAALPVILPNDLEAIEVALYAALAGPSPRICRIRNTGHLERLWVSEALLGEVMRTPGLTLEAGPAPLPFGDTGNLLDLQY